LQEREQSSHLEEEPALEKEPALETVLKGQAVELWWDSQSERVWIVADESDARRVMLLEGVGRGSVYCPSEARRLLTIRDPETVREVHRWKRRFDGTVGKVS
jgi:hypothetical protein